MEPHSPTEFTVTADSSYEDKVKYLRAAQKAEHLARMEAISKGQVNTPEIKAAHDEVKKRIALLSPEESKRLQRENQIDYYKN